ncbi:MAG: S41 family peptidase [Bacteroidota bacterium]
MKKLQHLFLRIRSLILVVILTASFTGAYSQGGESDFEISKNLDIFVTLYKQLQVNYVDDLNSGQLMKTAIDAMLESVDPYTVYIPESEIEDYRFMTTGQYGGIGSMIQKRNAWVYISEPYQGFPADKAGLKAGDKIIEINGKSAKGKTVEEVSTALKGQPGTEVKLLIERDTTEKPFEKSIIREEITVENVPYSGMVSDSIGYINLSEFKQNAGSDVKDAFLRLKENHNLKGVILDLRGNGGGLLAEAVNIVNIFVERGQLVVSTKGKLKDRNNNHNTMNAPVDLDMPLVVLVNEGSASASEIVTGAIQDLDRGVVIGQRTYGKGLVQNIVPLTYNAQMKVTIAKYYIPSGRCVQELDYAHKDNEGEATKMADSLKRAFKTKNGRTVYEGGGIDPDILMAPEEYSNIAQALITNYLVFDYATTFYRAHPQIAKPKDFIITDDIYTDFQKFLSNKHYSYTTQSEKALEKLKENAEKEKYFDAIKTEFDVLQNKMMHEKTDDLQKFKSQISILLKLYIIPRYYYQKGRIEAALVDDPEVKKAIEVLQNRSLYKSILDGTYIKENPKEKK